jgi:hypothetical protein
MTNTFLREVLYPSLPILMCSRLENAMRRLDSKKKTTYPIHLSTDDFHHQYVVPSMSLSASSIYDILDNFLAFEKI